MELIKPFSSIRREEGEREREALPARNMIYSGIKNEFGARDERKNAARGKRSKGYILRINWAESWTKEKASSFFCDLLVSQ